MTKNKIRGKIGRFTGACQSGFRLGTSCADSAWVQRMLVSVVISKHRNFHNTDIDMCGLVDMLRHLKQSNILNVLHQACCNFDELRVLRLLLTYTRLMVSVKTVQSAELAPRRIVFDSVGKINGRRGKYWAPQLPNVVAVPWETSQSFCKLGFRGSSIGAEN